MHPIIERIMRKVARAATSAIYPPLRARAIKLSAIACDASALADLEREFRPPFAAAPSPNRSAWPEIPEVDVSFVVPCYNVERYVRECVESILAQQTSRALEVVVVDDGSTDSTGTVLDELAAKDSRVRVIHQANCGFSGARNAGLKNVRGGGNHFRRLRRQHPEGFCRAAHGTSRRPNDRVCLGRRRID